MNKARIKASALAVAALVVGSVVALGAPASANSDSSTKSYPGGKLTAYVYIQDWSDANNCGSFTTRASSTKTLSYISNHVDWDPIGIGASASIKGVGSVSVSGNNGASPSATVTNKSAKTAGISGIVCMSWSTIYLGVFSTAETKVGGVLYPISAHV